jgi:hypothetical protein
MGDPSLLRNPSGTSLGTHVIGGIREIGDPLIGAIGQAIRNP